MSGVDDRVIARSEVEWAKFTERVRAEAFEAGREAGLAEARAAIEKQIDRVDNRPRHGAPSALDRAVERVVTGSLRAALASLDEGGTSE